MSAGQLSITATAEPQRTETTLVGFADVTLPELGLIIRVAIHEGHGQRWVELPDEARVAALAFADGGAS